MNGHESHACERRSSDFELLDRKVARMRDEISILMLWKMSAMLDLVHIKAQIRRYANVMEYIIGRDESLKIFNETIQKEDC